LQIILRAAALQDRCWLLLKRFSEGEEGVILSRGVLLHPSIRRKGGRERGRGGGREGGRKYQRCTRRATWIKQHNEGWQRRRWYALAVGFYPGQKANGNRRGLPALLGNDCGVICRSAPLAAFDTVSQSSERKSNQSRTCRSEDRSHGCRSSPPSSRDGPPLASLIPA